MMELKMTINLFKTLALCAAVSTPFAVNAAGLDGAAVVITNTFQGGQTDGVETDVGKFGMVNNVFSTVGDAVEFPQFITLYDVDITSDAVAFTWITSEMADRLSGPTPDGTHDRNYLTFDLPAGVVITEVGFDAAGSDLLEGSATPTAEIISGNKVVVDFASGVVRGVGFNPRFTVTTGAPSQ
jgi:hypothetical protein